MLPRPLVALTPLLAVLLPAAPTRGDAQGSVTLTLEPAAQDFAQKAGVSPADIEPRIRQEIERIFQLYGGRLEDYLRLVGDANAFTTKGLGVDYATNLKFVMVGAAVNLSANAESALTPDDLKGKPPVAALSTNFTLMGGLNLGLIGLSPVTIFGNYFKGSGNLGDEFTGDLHNWGLHGQLKLGAPDEEKLRHAVLQWGGIAITSGVDYSKTQLRLGKKFKRDFPFGMVAGHSVNVNADNMSALTVDLETYSVPLEVTTALRLLYILTAYGGLGFDWQLGGGSRMAVDMGASLAGSVMGQETPIGSAKVTASADAEPTAGRVRGILGAQVNIAIVRLFAQLNFIPNPFLASIAFGARLAY
jgi:hypothetical protein